jgi:hypothetical protein
MSNSGFIHSLTVLIEFSHSLFSFDSVSQSINYVVNNSGTQLFTQSGSNSLPGSRWVSWSISHFVNPSLIQPSTHSEINSPLGIDASDNRWVIQSHRYSLIQLCIQSFSSLFNRSTMCMCACACATWYNKQDCRGAGCLCYASISPTKRLACDTDIPGEPYLRFGLNQKPSKRNFNFHSAGININTSLNCSLVASILRCQPGSSTCWTTERKNLRNLKGRTRSVKSTLTSQSPACLCLFQQHSCFWHFTLYSSMS